MFKEQYRRDNEQLKVREGLLMEIKEQAAGAHNTVVQAENNGGQKQQATVGTKPPGHDSGGHKNKWLRGGLAAAIAVVLICIVWQGVWGPEPVMTGTNSDSAVQSGAEQSSVADYAELYTYLAGLQQENSQRSGDMPTAANDVAALTSGMAESSTAADSDAMKYQADSTTVANSAADGGSQANDFSTTNTQVAGVDEADIFKTDGQFIYYLADNKLIICKADGASSAVVSQTTCFNNDEETAGNWYSCSEMYIAGDRLFIIAVNEALVWREVVEDQAVDGAAAKSVAGDGTEEGTGESFNQPTTQVLVYDISDRSQPQKISELGQTGRYVSSRLIDGYIYLVTTQDVYSLLREQPLSYCPGICDAATGNSYQPIAASDISIDNPQETPRYTVVSSIAVADAAAHASVKAVLGGAGIVYANSEHLIVAAAQYDYVNGEASTDAEGRAVVINTSDSKTNLLMYSLKDGQIEQQAAATVPGTLVNQFALDEYNGYIRVVTTVNKWEERIYTEGVDTYEYDDYSGNNLYVLDARLQQVGALEELAEDETVQSVRFDGDIAYFVTFRQVDPLFTVDLSKPEEPQVMSSLKISGFSEYLHVYGPGQLLGIGYEADEETGWTENVKLTMFDTSDKSNVSAITTSQLEASWTEIGSNHKAVLVNVERSIIAFPADEHYYIFSYSAADGFTQEADVSFKDDNWWYGSGLRGAYIGEYLYICSQGGLEVLSLADYNNVLSLDFA